MSDPKSHVYKGVADLERMVEFARRALAGRWPDSTYWHPGDMVWMHPKSDLPGGHEDLRLWMDGDDVAGLGWFYAPVHARIDVRPDVGVGALFDEIVAWSESRRRATAAEESPVLTLHALDSDRERIDALDRRGYKKIDRGGVLMRRSLETPIAKVALPSGMRFRDGEDVDLEERVFCHTDAWSHLSHLGMPDARSSFTLAAYRRLRAQSIYRPELDLAAETEDHTVAACLIGWIDDVNGIGLVEPVGTRYTFRRRGLARALNLEVLRRFRKLGMHTAHIGTATFNEWAKATYLSCGFEIIDADYYYAKRLAPGAG